MAGMGRRAERTLGLSRSRIANLLAVASAIYGWASRPTRRLVPSNPTRAVELPPNDERSRERVATTEEAAALLDVLPADLRVPYALAFYAGLRRSEIDRLEWADVDLNKRALMVRRSKSEAGTGRRVPDRRPSRADPRRSREQQRQGLPGRSCPASPRRGRGIRGRYVDHETDTPTQKRKPPLAPIDFHEAQPHLRVAARGSALHAQGGHRVHRPRRPHHHLALRQDAAATLRVPIRRALDAYLAA